MRLQGQIVEWNDDRGFGFILADGESENIFVHISAFDSPRIRPEAGMEVSYFSSWDKRGRKQAQYAELLVADSPRTKNAAMISVGVVFASAFLFCIVCLAILALFPVVAVAVYCLMSFVTFLAYAFDKLKAQANRWRTPEATLHMLSLLGGWPGAIVAQQFLRHKNRKESFQLAFWATVFLNLGLFGLLMAEVGREFLQEILTR